MHSALAISERKHSLEKVQWQIVNNLQPPPFPTPTHLAHAWGLKQWKSQSHSCTQWIPRTHSETYNAYQICKIVSAGSTFWEMMTHRDYRVSRIFCNFTYILFLLNFATCPRALEQAGTKWQNLCQMRSVSSLRCTSDSFLIDKFLDFSKLWFVETRLHIKW